MIKTRIYIKNEQKFLKISLYLKILLKKCCKIILNSENFKKNVEISLFFVNDEKIKLLNNKYRNKNKSTDVLSFPLVDNFKFETDENNFIALGDIVISTQTAILQAKTYGHSIKREIVFLFTHSMLHLLGYDHESNEVEAKLMRSKERSILKKLKFIEK